MTMPLAQQEVIFTANFPACLILLDNILDEYRAEIVALARERLRQGFQTYGDAAFHWPASVRLQNLLEELADALVYSVSGPVD